MEKYIFRLGTCPKAESNKNYHPYPPPKKKTSQHKPTFKPPPLTVASPKTRRELTSLFSNNLWHQPLLVGFRVQSHTRGVIQGLFQPADIKSSRAQKGEHPPGAEKSVIFCGWRCFFWWLEPRFCFSWCWEKSYCFLPNLLELDDGVGTSIGFASDLLWYMQGNRRYFLGSMSSNGLVDVSKWRYLSMLRPAENFWRILPIQKVTTCCITTSRNIRNSGTSMKLWCRLEGQLEPVLSLGVNIFWTVSMTVNNSKFNHRSTEKSLSNFAMSQLLEVYEYFPPKNYNGWFTWKSPSKWKGNSSDPNLHFFFGEKGP